MEILVRPHGEGGAWLIYETSGKMKKGLRNYAAIMENA
jgi:hypothetical protein